MGTKIYRESYLPGYQYHSVRNNNEIPTNSNWSLFCGRKAIQNGQHCNGILPETQAVTNSFSGYKKEALKQMMLTHEAAFKHQVSELHRLYKVQKDIMNEIKRTELYNHQISINTPPSSTSLVNRVPYEDSPMTWHKSPLSMVHSHDFALLGSRPSKARKCLFDLHLTADNYIDVEEEAIVVPENKITVLFNNSFKRNNKADSGIGASIDSKVQNFDLNEPYRDDDMDDTSHNNLSQKSNNGREQIFCTNGAGPQDESPIDTTQLVFSKDINPENVNGPTFSHTKLLKLPISDGYPRTENKVGLIDINLIYEFDAEVAERENEKETSDVSGHIDLNMCASDEEITSVPSGARTNCDIEKIELDINLDEKDTSTLHKDKLGDEGDTSAAMALVKIASFINIEYFEENTSVPSEDTLFWFSKIASSHSESLESDLRIVSKEIDEFEAMTLSLLELKEEEYMPKPFILEKMELENETILVDSRARRRKKRDFQRDVLPGMTSLSRHEVAEDVHTFARIMKAMGHSLAKKNGGSGRRGRPRLVAEVAPLADPKVTCKPLIMEHNSSVEIGLEERVLTGWGEIPRRPRRRRCHVGNLSSVAFS